MTTDAPDSSPSRAGTEPGTGLVALAARLAEALASEPRLRIPLERLWQLHATVDPGATGGQVRRERLAAALQELASQGKLRPAASSDGRTPPLPRFVTLQRPDRPVGHRRPTSPGTTGSPSSSAPARRHRQAS